MNRKYFEEEYIMMKRPRFVQEHENLIRVLETGDPKALKKEAKEQKKELQKEVKKKAKKDHE